VRIRPACAWFAHTFVPGPDCGLVYPVLSSRARACRRNYQVPRVPLPDVGVTFIRETCTSPPGTLLPVLSSYGLIRQSLVALPYFGVSPRSWSLCRLLPVPAATGTFPMLSLRIFPWMPEPMPRRSAECICLVLPQPASAFPIIRLGRLPACLREYDFPRVGFRGCSYFVMFRPPSLLASQIVPTAASFLAGQPRLFTSKQNVCRYLHTHRTCYPPDYRQLAERGLSPRKIRSLIGCSRMMPTFPLPPLKVGSRSGAVSLRFSIPGAPRFLWDWTH
jgi:hypothetical protein